MFLIITVEMGVRSLHRLKTSSGPSVSTSDAYYETITDIKLFAGNLVLAFVTGNFFDHKT